jgi:hypothetical protein
MENAGAVRYNIGMSNLAHPDGRRRPGLMMKKNWFKEHRLLVIIIAAIIVAAAVCAILFLFNDNKAETNTDQVAAPKPAEEVHHYSPLTGRETTEKKTSAPVLAVMVENSLEARPQSGLTDAGVVFEAIAEGGITRFVVLFQESEPSLIGPVRSVRPYYIDWAAAFDVGIAHVGGSDEAVKMAQSGAYGVDLDQFFNDSAYWRSKDRKAPHNVYTDYSHLIKLLESKGKTASKFTGFTRQDIAKNDENPAPETSENEAETANTINLTISSYSFNVSYQYDATTGTYARSEGGKPHLSRALDGTTAQIAPDVVVAMHVNQTLSSDRVHNQIATTAGGEVFIFQDGTVTKGTWSKASAKSQIKFTDASGQEIKLKRGQTWVTAVPNGKAITWQ